MRVIITGGTGMIGRPLAESLVKQGHEVIVLSRNPNRYQFHEAIQLCSWDAHSGDSWSHLIDANTAIINLAGESPAASKWTDEHKARVLRSRLDAANAVIQAIRQAKERPSVLLQASASGYYGDKGAALLTEDSPAGDNWRARVTVEWEQALCPVQEMGVRTVWLRIGIVLDPAGGALPPLMQAAKLMGRQMGDGEQYMPWVHRNDVTGMIHYLLENDDADGFYNLCVPQPATNAEMMQALTDVLKRPALIPVPAFALRLALGEMATTALDSQRVIPQRLMDEGYSFKFTSLDTALRDLLD
jgi:uncharacterized protein (TIGR01777 family)